MTGQHVPVNRDYWNGMAADWIALGEQLWRCEAPRWGIWGLPEADLSLLPTNLDRKDTIELGCGTGYVSGWMARRGARATGIDISAEQLATAHRLAEAHEADITFVEGDAEATGLPDAAFDVAISEYGAAIWCDPQIWLREAWRLLRPGGELVFLGTHPLALVTAPESGAPSERVLHRPYRGLQSIDWTAVEIDPGGIEFNLTISGWMRLFGEVGFEVVRYLELFAPESEQKDRFAIPADWAKAYPSEQVWHLSKPK
ncbi:ubiquinone/menaquinone biosynthesis C-methylase UbiE [Aliiruegeria haliotis]|uniref:Ubiquinone/menaquinone biosynthesis C-methylase UbiE n=1 Tax=Aliiruegeria haliotis TaxID=1280846 RepID=A0A2T0RK38_9RHOB|nr:class I SAM-dependent methyltransferase [Aliiruegeria haliotis]PRY21487.1 ubiquinone/menaquinone biosynthesis C-methylase UbiE [Aliiruegeria haliotis]